MKMRLNIVFKGRVMIFRKISAVSLSAALLAACGSGGDETPRVTDDGPAYLVATRVWDDTVTTSYFHVVSSLESDATLDESRALEVTGAAKLYAVGDIGWFAVGGGEEPTITRYTLSDDGTLEEGARISLVDFGVRSLWDTLYVVSETKMYYADREGGQLIIVNPTEMTVDGVIEIPEANREGYLALYGYTPIFRDDKLLFTVGWFDWEENDAILPETGLVVIDTTADSVERVDVDTRCGGITTGVVTESGDAYFVSSAMAGAAHRLGRLSTSPCALKVGADADAFDRDFMQPLADLTGSDVLGEPVPAGGSSVYLRVFDESQATVTEESLTWELTGQTVWSWWRWDTDSGEAVRVEEIAPSTADASWFEVDGRLLGVETTESYSESTLIDLTAEGGPQAAISVPGFLHGVARIR
jgi:hypothetical protein